MGFSLDVTMIASITVGFLFYAGFGIARLLACESMRGQELLIAPLVGFSLSVIVGYWCGWLRWSASVGLVVVLCLATLLNVLALVQRRNVPLRVWEHLPILALAFCMLVMGIYPLWSAGVLRPIGSNGDQVVYGNLADYLERNTFPSPPPSGWHPVTVQLSRVSEYGFPIGLSYLHAFIDKLSSMEAYKTFSIVTAVSAALSVLVYAWLATCLCGAGRLASFLAALFTAVSPLLLWVHYNNYGMHAIGLGLVPLAFGVAVLTLEEGRGLPLLPALLLSAAFVTYPPAAVVFALCPTVLYVALSCIQRRDRLAPALRGLFALFTLAVLLNPPGILHAGRFFLHMTDLEWVTQFGDLARHIPWAELYGLSHHALLTQMSPVAFSTGLSSLLVVIALLCTFYGVWRTKGMGRRAFLALAILYGSFLFWLRYALDYPYGFFKALTFTTFPAFIGLALGIEHFLLRTKSGFGKRRMAIALPFVAVVVVTNLIILLALSRQVATTALDFPALASLSNIRGNIPYGESIHIRDARDTPLLWMTYFLKDYNLSFSHFTPYYPRRDWSFYQDAISSDLVLVNKDVSLAAPWASETVYENSNYRILRKDSRILAHLDFQEGGQALRRGDTIRLDGLIDRLAMDGHAFALAPHVQSGAVIRLGVLAPAGSIVKHNVLGQEETILLTQDVSALDWPIRGELSRISLTNESARPLRLLGWLEVVAEGWKAGSGPSIPGIFELYQEEVMPHSGFFVVRGWHSLEEGQRRWTKEASLAIFRNPRRPVLLAIEGVMRPYPDVIPPTKATILLNGQALGEVDEPGAFRQTYFLPEGLLGSSAWGDLEITVDHTFSPKQLGFPADPRDLGLAITRVELVDVDLAAGVDLAADGVIDLGTQGARKHLGPGWSSDEQGERVTFVWGEGQESLLWASFPGPSDYEVEIRLLPFTYLESLPQELNLYVNGHHLWDISLPNGGWQTHSFRLPRSFLSEGVNVFRFVYRYVVSPQEIVPWSQDRRRLAVAFDFMRFRPE